MADQQYTIHLNNVVRIPSTRKANKALFAIKEFVKKHTHAKVENIHISNDVNELVWARGKEHKINRLDVVLRTKEGKVHVFTPNGKQLKAFEAKPVAKPAKKDAKAAPAKETPKVEKKIALEKAVKEEMSEKKTPGTSTDKKAHAPASN